MKSWIKEFRLQGTANIILFFLWCALLVIWLASLIELTFFDGHPLLWALFCVSFLLLNHYSPYFVLNKRFHVFSEKYGLSEWIRSTEFKDDEIILSDHTTVLKFKYEDIKEIKETSLEKNAEIKEKNNVVMIFFKKDRNRAIRLYKDAFVEGTYEECKAKIISKMK